MEEEQPSFKDIFLQDLKDFEQEIGKNSHLKKQNKKRNK